MEAEILKAKSNDIGTNSDSDREMAFYEVHEFTAEEFNKIPEPKKKEQVFVTDYR